jgi:cytosine/adenosine deaminase-related metal-dependent hydrolase
MIYILHIDPPLAHARHYVGWTADEDVSRRVREHLEQTGRRPSRLVAAALAAGRAVTLAGALEGDRALERRLKARKGAASFCPLCRAAYNSRAAARMRARRARARAVSHGFGQEVQR